MIRTELKDIEDSLRYAVDEYWSSGDDTGRYLASRVESACDDLAALRRTVEQTE